MFWLSPPAISLDNMHQSLFMSALSTHPDRSMSLCWEQHCKLLPGVAGITATTVAKWTIDEVRECKRAGIGKGTGRWLCKSTSVLHGVFLPTWKNVGGILQKRITDLGDIKISVYFFISLPFVNAGVETLIYWSTVSCTLKSSGDCGNCCFSPCSLFLMIPCMSFIKRSLALYRR